jgi:hypothetical protein
LLTALAVLKLLGARPTTGTTGVPTRLVSFGVVGLLQLSKKSSSPPSSFSFAAADAGAAPSTTTPSGKRAASACTRFPSSSR